MADPSLFIILLSLTPIILHCSSLSLATIVTTQTASPDHLFCLQEPWACFAFLAVLYHLLPRASVKRTSLLAWPLTIILIVLFVLFFLGGGFVISSTTQVWPRLLILIFTSTMVFGILRWAQISLIPLKQDQWLQKGWRLFLPLSALNVLITSVRIAFA